MQAVVGPDEGRHFRKEAADRRGYIIHFMVQSTELRKKIKRKEMSKNTFLSADKTMWKLDILYGNQLCEIGPKSKASQSFA